MLHFKQRLARAVLKMTGWKSTGSLPASPKYVVLGVPHTSNWDLAVLLFGAWALGFDPSWLGKRALFKPPLGWMMTKLGGVPVDRNKKRNIVEQVVDVFQSRDALTLAIAPEGTRSRSEFWRSGFYHIAKQANVPIVCAFVDYSRRETGLGLILQPSDDIHADMNQIRAFYTGESAPRGLFPEKMGPVRLKEEVS